MVNVLFLCAGNTCRSQMAEGFANFLGGGFVESSSAGLEPGSSVNPYAVRVMKEIGIDISAYRSKALDHLLLEKADIVVTLCGDRDANCPALKRSDMRSVHLPVADPSAVEGSEEEILAAFRETRDEIAGKVDQLMTKIMGL